jgi:exodeoxyribonuclease VII large subunit
MTQMPAVTGIDKESAVSITQISQKIKDVLSENPQFRDIFLKGEISNFRKAVSGHIYFDLKDNKGILACGYFKDHQDEISNDLGDGIQIVTKGSLTSFEPKSQYQLKITKIAKNGRRQHLTRNKAPQREAGHGGPVLNNDGKKKVPPRPNKVGIIASKDSEAIQDILHVINSRNPKVETVMAHAKMQGEGAPSSIIKALNYLNEDTDSDVIILAKCSGNSEDLMAFNDEGLVRAVASRKKPVVTGIGHAEDMSLVDLAADVKATTPSTAAEAAVPEGHKSDLQKYRVVITALITVLVLLIIVFLIADGLISI